MSLLLHIIVTCIKENIIKKLQELYSPLRNPRAINKSPVLFEKKPLCTGNLWPARKIFTGKPVCHSCFSWKWPFSSKKTSHTEEKDSKHSENKWYFYKIIERLWSAFVISSQKFVFCFVRGPYWPLFCAQVGPQNSNF